MRPKETLGSLIEAALQSIEDGQTITIPRLSYDLTAQQKAEFGDYSTNVAFLVAPHVKQSPAQVAATIRDTINATRSPIIQDIQIAGGGFINFFLHDKALFDCVNDIVPPKQQTPETKQRVIVEYSSPNVAKPMHIGHLRATVLGDALANLYTYAGHTVVRWNHLGDWGTQFGKLIVAYTLWGNAQQLNNSPIDHLLSLYVRFHNEAEQDPTLEDRARAAFKALEEGNAEYKKLFTTFKRLSLKEFETTYKRLGIRFNVIKGESEYNRLNKTILQELKEKHIAHESQGALVVDIEGDKDPALLQKSDGSTLYLTRDLASMWYRVNQFRRSLALTRFHPQTLLYIVGSEQIHHFEQLFAIAHRLPWARTIKTEHVAFGLVRLNENGTSIKLSTRKGATLKASDVLDAIIQTARKSGEELNPSLTATQQKEIASSVGISAAKYAMLKDNRTSVITIDTKEAISLKGNSAPYLHYTYARLGSILQKETPKTASPLTLTKQEKPLIHKALEFDTIITTCLSTNSPHHLAQYLFELCNAINTYYETTHILSDTNTRRKHTRLTLIRNLRTLLRQGMTLLGIDPLETL